MSFQVGTLANPLQILWAPSHYDKGKKSRAIKVFVDDEKAAQDLQALDESLVTQGDDGRFVLRLKVWQNAKVTMRDGNKKMKVDDLRRGDKILVMAKRYDWVYEGREGVSLSSGNVLVVEQSVCGSYNAAKWV